MDAFSPAAPIDRRDVFAGRGEELTALVEVLHQRGQHAVIYGERGVGKTSLATVAAEIARGDESCFAAHVICDSTDDYGSIWQKVFEEISVVLVRSGGSLLAVSRRTMRNAGGASGAS